VIAALAIHVGRISESVEIFEVCEICEETSNNDQHTIIHRGSQRDVVQPVLALCGDAQLLNFALDGAESLGGGVVVEQLRLRELVQVFEGLGLFRQSR
jgi:hypothetical protein